MHIKRIHIEGFKRHKKFDLELNKTITVIVGDNETGKSSLLEAIHLVLTRQYDGRVIDHSLDPYLFNTLEVAEYFQAIREGYTAAPPKILIEAYFNDDKDNPELAKLKGTNNSRSEDCPGVKLTIDLDKDFLDALKEYAKDETNPPLLPVEFFKCEWKSFSENTFRNLFLKSKTIDTSLPRMVRGPNRYVSQLISDVLDKDQRRELSLAYKKMRHGFSKADGVTVINAYLEKQGSSATNKKLTVQVDLSSRSTWDSSVAAHLDDLPFDCAGKGEQCRIQMRLAIADSTHTSVLLIEEPENHLSHTNLNMLMKDVTADCVSRQVILTTHSTFVLNKLGLDNLRLISTDGSTLTLSNLSPETKAYFLKLPGYDTLRLILSKHCILVEGPSDDLIVQRAYKNIHNKLPIEDGIDVVSVGSLAFMRFLEIADKLNLKVTVITDNDGDVKSLESKYNVYLQGSHKSIRIFYDDDESCCTLEPQVLKANSLISINKILGKNYLDDEALLKHMKRHKTDCALKLFETAEDWHLPNYILNAIK